MLSLKSRLVALTATGALAALLALPAFAQAFWWDYDDDDASVSGTVSITAMAEPRSYPQTISVAYESTGPAVSGPSSVTVSAGQTSTEFDVWHGTGQSGDEIWIGMTGPTTQGAHYIYLW